MSPGSHIQNLSQQNTVPISPSLPSSRSLHLNRHMSQTGSAQIKCSGLEYNFLHTAAACKTADGTGCISFLYMACSPAVPPSAAPARYCKRPFPVFRAAHVRAFVHDPEKVHHHHPENSNRHRRKAASPDFLFWSVLHAFLSPDKESAYPHILFSAFLPPHFFHLLRSPPRYSDKSVCGCSPAPFLTPAACRRYG